MLSKMIRLTSVVASSGRVLNVTTLPKLSVNGTAADKVDIFASNGEWSVKRIKLTGRRDPYPSGAFASPEFQSFEFC